MVSVHHRLQTAATSHFSISPSLITILDTNSLDAHVVRSVSKYNEFAQKWELCSLNLITVVFLIFENSGF